MRQMEEGSHYRCLMRKRYWTGQRKPTIPECGPAPVTSPILQTGLPADVLKPNLRAGGRTYRGIDRLRWEDFELAYYGGNLPTHLLSIWQDLRAFSCLAESEGFPCGSICDSQ